MMNGTKNNSSYLLAVTGAVILSWIIHEFAHWLTSESLGYDTLMRLNGTSPAVGESPSEWENVLISASGPLVTILQAVVAFLVLRFGGWNKYLYPFLFTAFYMRSLAGIMNFIHPNDEGRIGQFLEIGIYTLPILVSAILFIMVYGISRQYRLSWKFHLMTTLSVMVASSVLILSDQFFEIRIL